MHKIIFIIIKDYNTDLSKRQPWYSVKKLVSDLENLNYEVNALEKISYYIDAANDDNEDIEMMKITK